MINQCTLKLLAAILLAWNCIFECYVIVRHLEDDVKIKSVAILQVYGQTVGLIVVTRSLGATHLVLFVYGSCLVVKQLQPLCKVAHAGLKSQSRVLNNGFVEQCGRIARHSILYVHSHHQIPIRR